MEKGEAMSRLIDADALIKAWRKKHNIKEGDCGAVFTGYSEIPRLIDEQQPVDAVPVVRCKDCKYMTEHYDTDGNVPYWTCSEWDSGTDYDGFCHYAERRNDED